MIGSLTRLLSGTSLRGRSLRATALSLTQAGGYKFLQLVSNLILTRLLMPEAFGLMALVTVFVGGLAMVSDVGIRPSVIRSERSDEAIFQSTAWTLQIVRGVCMTLIAWVFAWPYAALYDQPVLAPMICVLAVSSSIIGFESIEVSMRQRRLAIGKVVAMHLLEKLLSIIVTIGLVWWTQSIWGLVFGALSGSAFKVALSLLMFPSPNHRLAWDRGVLHEILTFGRWILLGTFFTYLGGQGLSAIRGLLIDLDTLAFLVIAGQFGWMIGEFVAATVSGVAYPALAQIVRERPTELRHQLRRIRLAILLPTIPGFILLSIVAEPMIDLLYDPRYAQAGPFLALLALNGAFGTLTMVYQNAMTAQGNSRMPALISGVEVAMRIIATIAGFYLGGVIGMIIGHGLATLGGNLLSMTVARQSGFADLKTDFAAIGIIGLFYVLQLSGAV